MAIGTLWSITLDCADAKELAEFRRAALDGKIAYESENFSGAETPTGVWIGAYRIEGYQPPQWPDGAPPKQFHLDLTVDDLDAAETRALELGATKAAHQPEPDRWRVLLDPAGHPFCLYANG